MTTKAWKGTAKRVPLIYSASIAAAATVNFTAVVQFNFRAEHMVWDPATATTVSSTLLSVGPNLQIAGGNNNATFSGQMFPPTQTFCMELGCDIASEGNSVSFSATSTLTSGSATYSAWVMGTCAEQMSQQEVQKAAQAGITAAGLWHGQAGVTAGQMWTGAKG